MLMYGLSMVQMPHFVQLVVSGGTREGVEPMKSRAMPLTSGATVGKAVH